MFNYRLLKVIKLNSLGLTNERYLDIDVVSCEDKIIEKQNEKRRKKIYNVLILLE